MLSRVADCLYWMSRYLERAEHTARVVDVCLDRLVELANPSDERWNLMLTSMHADLPEVKQMTSHQKARALIFDAANSASLSSCVERARENARQVREQISSEMWEHLNQLFLFVRGSSTLEMWEAQPHEFFQAVKEGAHLFQGIADSTMNHSEGWDFVQVGKFIERASSVAALLDAHYRSFLQSSEDAIGADDYFDWVSVLKSCTAFEAYCKVYTANLRPYSIAEFLLLNPDFPHSIRFSIEMVQSGLSGITEATKTQRSGRANRLAGRLLAALNYSQIEEVMNQGVNDYLEDVQKQCGHIHGAIYQTYISYKIDSSRLGMDASNQ